MNRFLDLADFSREEVLDLIALAQHLEKHPEPQALAGKILGLVFFNPSLRTLSSFQVGMMRLGGSSFVITPGQGTWQLETRTGAVELEARTGAEMTATHGEVMPLLAQFLELSARYRAYWPAPPDCLRACFRRRHSSDPGEAAADVDVERHVVDHLAVQGGAVEALRELNLYKPPGVAETIDWATALGQLGATELDERVGEHLLHGGSDLRVVFLLQTGRSSAFE